MANSQDKITLPQPGEVVGAKRGGPAHLVDGLQGGKALITPREMTKPIVPQPSSTQPYNK